MNAFFAATEIAVISLNENKLKSLSDEGDKKAGKLLRIIEDPTKFLSTIQVGITLAGFLGSAFAADNFAERLTALIARMFSVPAGNLEAINTISVIVITLILSYFTLVLGELVPKRLAMKNKDKLARGVCGIISALTVALKPLIWFLTVSTNGVLRICGVNPHEKEEPVSEEDIVIMLDAGVDEGTLDGDDIQYIKNVFKLDKLTAAGVMTQRSNMIAVPQDISEEELMAVIRSEGYSRIPVYGETIDDVVGILRVKDYLVRKDEEGFDIKSVLLPPSFIPETMHLDVLFREMQKEHMHVCTVVNEYGHTSGIITMEDILEELVGEIWDEQDEEITSIVETAENTYKVSSGLSIDAFFDFFKLTDDTPIESTTVNGWLAELFGDIPEAGATISYQSLEITVTSADEVMTHEISVKLVTAEQDGDAQDKE